MKQMTTMQDNLKIKWWKNTNILFGIIGIIGVGFTMFTYFFPEKPNLKYYILANTSVLDVKEQIIKLNVSYDSINLLTSNQNISIILIEIKNDGNKDIILNDYDQLSEFGLKISGGKLLKKPELVSSADNNYFKDVILGYNENIVKFKYKLIDSDQYFRLKLLVIHEKENLPVVTSLGKVSGMNKIEVLGSMKSGEIDLKKQNRDLLYFFIGTLFMGILLFVIRTQRAINKSLIVENFEIKTLNQNLLNEKVSKPKSILELDTSSLIQTFEKPGNLGKILRYHELINLKKGEVVFHERFGRGVVINIEEGKSESDYKGEFKFDDGGTKRLLLRFASLYKLKQ